MIAPVFKVFHEAPGLEPALTVAKREAEQRCRHHAIRFPHHTVGLPGIAGGLRRCPETGIFLITPGEIMLAGGGVLVLDDLPEFRREVISAIALAFQDQATLFRHGPTGTVVEVPTRFSIYATQQGCPCGRVSVLNGPPCKCTPGSIERWGKRVDGYIRMLKGISCPST
jgi:magnesium chelatase family protein